MTLIFFNVIMNSYADLFYLNCLLISFPNLQHNRLLTTGKHSGYLGCDVL